LREAGVRPRSATVRCSVCSMMVLCSGTAIFFQTPGLYRHCLLCVAALQSNFQGHFGSRRRVLLGRLRGAI
jgi:hypothetical protein